MAYGPAYLNECTPIVSATPVALMPSASSEGKILNLISVFGIDFSQRYKLFYKNTSRNAFWAFLLYLYIYVVRRVIRPGAFWYACHSHIQHQRRALPGCGAAGCT